MEEYLLAVSRRKQVEAMVGIMGEGVLLGFSVSSSESVSESMSIAALAGSSSTSSVASVDSVVSRIS